MQLAHLGIVARFVGDYERATALLNESLAFRKKLGEYQGIAFVLRSLGQVALNQNDSGRAAAYFRESLILSSENGDTWLCEESLQGCAAIASAAGHYQRAARLIGAAERLQEILGWRPSPPTQADYDKRKASTRGALTDFVFETAWAEGRAMTLEQAVEYALAGNTIKSGVAGEPP
jgi:non-specific serine/threonine protein kinase